MILSCRLGKLIQLMDAGPGGNENGHEDNQSMCPQQAASWEHAHPCRTTQRDLIGEIADDLGKRNIRLMLYFASHTLGGLEESSAREYWSIHEQVLSEFGRRYGARVAGYWFDGWYQTLERYPELSLDSASVVNPQGGLSGR